MPQNTWNVPVTSCLYLLSYQQYSFVVKFCGQLVLVKLAIAVRPPVQFHAQRVNADPVDSFAEISTNISGTRTNNRPNERHVYVCSNPRYTYNSDYKGRIRSLKSSIGQFGALKPQNKLITYVSTCGP